MAKEDHDPKIGAGHAEAMFRQGLAELRGALFNESNVAQPPQYGLYGTKTPGEVADARRAGEDYDRGEEPRSTLPDRLQQAERDERAQDHERPGRNCPANPILKLGSAWRSWMAWIASNGCVRCWPSASGTA